MTAPHFHVPYRAYAIEEAVEDSVERVPSPGGSESFSWVGLSPFDIPDLIDVEIVSANECIFRFDYPNDEPGETNTRPASRDGAVAVLLGQNTRKVLAIFVKDALAVLAKGSVQIDLSYVERWQIGLPSHALNTCRRNVQLVNKILTRMPGDFRTEVIRAMSETDRPPQAADASE